MIVYHGSNSNFKTLRIDKKLVKHQSTLDNEGLGIYFSTDRSVAESYGKYVYVLEINDYYFSDFRNYDTCYNYVSHIVNIIKNEVGINLSDYMYRGALESTVDRLNLGGLAISGVGRELSLLLDSEESFFKLSETKRNKIFRLLKQCDKNCPKAYMFTYHIENIGVIKDVSESVVRIIRKETR